ncbi:biotin-dependent carboxyltransferase family protein [Marmoricola sp. RAF53]|uniref:5-oxoprolinase subunit C family protein n=1 Tax=Marmoricola sp. RAF53 TaxID=3233059 RepID=UPI003F94C9A9
MPETARHVVVEDPGLLTTVQDLGRPGFAHLGVPLSGALDQPALRLANRLVGNPESAAGLEVTATGCRLRFDHAGAVAVTGASCPVRIGGRPVGWGLLGPVPAGAVVELGPAADGLRSYLGVAGGIEVPPVLGSRSTDLLSGTGPAPLAAGDRLPVGRPPAAPAGGEAVPVPRRGVLTVLAGPHEDWFTAASLAALDGASYTVLPASNRIGLRLDGPVLARSDPDRELPSEPMVLGSVQVPPNGRPVVFLQDHPTTGGYPVIGVVRAADLPVCAQARPGERLTLRLAPGRLPNRPPG